MELPSSVGPWVVERVIGRGGMGVVARVHHARDGRPGALKWVGAVSPATLRSFRSEVRALQRLRHPQIVAILDHGQVDGFPWHVMALVEGRPLREGFETTTRADRSTVDFGPGLASGDTPAPAPDRGRPAPTGFLADLHSLCRPLAVLHAEGLSHGDLKPDNVLVGPDGEAVLLDFGLARTFLGREQLELAHRRSGTPGYVAPEVLRGEPVDGRVDLYALGCMLFEGFAGQPPFVGPPREVARAHRETRPPRLSEVAPQVPPRLAALVDALLAKEPGRRPAHADEVAAVLEACGVHPRRPADRERPTRGCLVRSALVGRAASLEATLAATGVVLVHGPAGIGRTRFLWELGHRLERARIRHHDLRDHDRASGALAELLRAVVDGAPEAALEPLVHPGTDLLVVRDELWRAAAAALTRSGPAWLLIDDLHLADELTVGFVAWVAAESPPQLTVVAAADLEGADALGAVTGNPSVLRVPLEPLEPGDAVALAAGLLGEPAGGAVAVSAAEASGGIPAWLVLSLRQALDHGHLVRSQGAWSWTAGAPPAAGGPWIAELAADPLTAELAILGAEADASSLVALGWEEEQVDRRLFELVRSGILDGEPRRFTSERVRRAIAAAVPPALARAAYERILSVFATAPGVRPAVLAEAAEALGDPRAPQWRLEAALALVAAGASTPAVAALRRVLAEGAPALRVRAALELCRVLANVRPAEVMSLARAGCTEAAAHGLPVPVRLLLHEGVALDSLGDPAAAMGRLREALAAVPDAEPTERVLVLVDLCRIEVEHAEPATAGRHLDEVESLGAAMALGPRVSVRIHRGRLCQRVGDPAGAVRWYEEALALLEQATPRQLPNRVTRAASVLTNVGVARQALGDPEAAMDAWRRALPLARQARALSTQIVLLLNLGAMAAERGELAEARASLAEARTVAAATKSPVWSAMVLVASFSAERRCGGTPDPAWLDEAEPALVRADHRSVLAHLACERGHQALALGEPAAPHLARARALGGSAVEVRESIDRLAAAVAHAEARPHGAPPG